MSIKKLKRRKTKGKGKSNPFAALARLVLKTSRDKHIREQMERIAKLDLEKYP